MLVTVAEQPDRYDPLPSVGELPAFLLRKLTPGRRRVLLVGGAVMFVAVVLAAALVIPHSRSQSSARDAGEARQQAAHLAALRAQ